VVVQVDKTGFFSVFAHNHRIDAPITSGSVELGEHASVELTIATRDLRVLDPEVPADTRAEIQQTMLGPKVLDAPRYPEIRFISARVASTGPQTWRISGQLTLHGQTHPVVLDVSEDGGVYHGSAEILQSDFGITPIRIAGGTVKVKDAVRIRFDVRLKSSTQENEPQVSRIP